MGNIAALVGRPNVGKSSLFNRLIGQKRSIVHEEEGTTRDRIEARCTFNDSTWTLVDTGGILFSPALAGNSGRPGEKDDMSRQVRVQVNRAIQESDLLLFVVDTRTGCLPLDLEVADLLRKSKKPMLLVANKADNRTLAEDAVDFYPLGVGEPIPVSSTQGNGITGLQERLAKVFQGKKEEPEAPSTKIAVVGRPNVGKSSFLNALLKDERLVVSDIPGTTRDPVDIGFKREGKSYTLVDTAGIRRFSKIKEEVLFQSVHTTREMIQKSYVCLVLVDGSTGIQRDDLQILRWVMEEGRGAVLVVNKWDLVSEKTEEETEKLIRHRLGNLDIVPILFTSALTGRNIVKVLEAAEKVSAVHASQFETHPLNEFLQDIKKKRALPGGRVPHVTYIVQTGTRPPQFLLFGSVERERFTPFSRFLERKLRETFPLLGTPVHFDLRQEKKKK